MAATYATPEDAYRAFFETFNARDADAWAGVMSYPHVRVSPLGESRIFATAAEYAGNASWGRFEATGWVRTQGIEPERVHQSAAKVHLPGGWARYNAAGEVILENRVTYILTRIGGSWGIQARFGLDSYAPNQDVAATAEEAAGLVTQYLDAWDARDFAACAELCNYPLIEVDPGSVRSLDAAAELAAALGARAWGGAIERDVRAVQVGGSAANVAVEVTLEGGRREQALFLVTNRDGHWGIRGRSIIEA